MDELGLGAGGFPVGEQITTSGVSSTTTACASVVDNPLITNIRLSITPTSINAPSAMRIDATGTNAPLVAGDTGSDGIFSPGETWQFIIQDFTNATLTASAISHIGIPDTNVPPTASGNILAVPVPEPGTAALLGLGLVALVVRRRSQA